MRNVRRRQVAQKKKRTHLVLMTFGILLAVYLTVTLLIGENGFMRYLELKDTRDRLLADNQVLQEHNNSIKSELENIESEPAMIEEMAREYGLTKDGELIYKFQDSDQ
jgi:cell division protein FtsB